MREIKFRVWDKFEKKFITLEDLQKLGAIHVENDGVISLSPHYRFATNMMLQTDTFDIQQYTGLKDKNGKEIYEGDIVTWGDNYNSFIEWYQETCQFVCHEVYPKRGRYAEPDRIHNIPAYTNDPEVLGNIYENPELLK